jgi:hypothetical protein
MTTVVVRSESGVLMEMDVPVGALARERFDEAIAGGRLTIVDTPVKWVDGNEGAKFLVDAEPEAEPTPTAEPAEQVKRGRKPAAADATELAPESDA